MPQTTQQRYLVKLGCSTRKRPERTCQEFIDYRPGQIVGRLEFPRHVPIEELVKSGHLAPIGDGTVEEV